MFNYDKIPIRMRAYNQWIVWRLESIGGRSKPTKIPYNGRTGYKASVTDPSSWSSFDVAVIAANEGDYNGISFVFTPDDPFCGVDLDVDEGNEPSEVQKFIRNKLNSYSEFSPSGRGVHIIVEGSVPSGRNNRQLGVEIYSSGRAFTMTGNVIDEEDKEIEDCSDRVLELWHEVGGVQDEDLTDYEIVNEVDIDDVSLVNKVCSSEKNNSYYRWLDGHNWSEAYRSVLCSLCLFSSDEEQVKRVVLSSPLVNNAPTNGMESRRARVDRLWGREYGYAASKGDKERGDYVYNMWSTRLIVGGSRELFNKLMEQSKVSTANILKSHNDRVLREASENRASNLRVKGIKDLPVPFKSAGLLTYSDLDLDIPEGIFSELVDELCLRTRNPSRVMAMWAILGFISGVAGRAYITEENIGLNIYSILTAGTNTGKTQHWDALEDIVRIATPQLLTRVFGGSPSSIQILAEEGQTKPSMALRLPDKGAWLQGVVDARTQVQAGLREGLLSIYDSSRIGSAWHIPKSIRVKKDNTSSISEFNMSMVLDTTIQYLSDFGLNDFTDGLMSRFIITIGPDVISDRQVPKRGFDLPNCISLLFDSLLKITTHHIRPISVSDMNGGAIGIPKRITIKHDTNLLDYIDVIEDETIGIIQDIQRKKMPPHYIASSRVLLNSKRIAAILAVIENPSNPIITKPIFDWSMRFVLSSVTSIINMFTSGSMGSIESKQESAMMEFVKRTINSQPDEPYVTLTQICYHVDKLECFSNSKLGARITRNKTIDDLCERDMLIRGTIDTATKPKSVITIPSYSD